MNKHQNISPEMEYKENKIKELLKGLCSKCDNDEEHSNEDCGVENKGMNPSYVRAFLSSTIDEILSCVPEIKNPEDYYELNLTVGQWTEYVKGFEKCLQQFYENMKKKLNI